MRRLFVSGLLLLLLVSPVFAKNLKLATTTSTENSGLLDYILPDFEKTYGVRVDVIAVGTGKAIKLAENGDVDIILVHAQSAEAEFVESGFGVKRYDVMYNDFVIVGPPSDPKKIRKTKTLKQALEQISNDGMIFLSRGDDSGTHKKELALWELYEIEPGDDWYLETGQGMGTTLLMASIKEAYTLTDRGTYLALKNKIDLDILFQGDQNLNNPYGIIAVNPAAHPKANYREAKIFIDWILSPSTQMMINNFKINGEQLFYTYQ